MSNNANPLKRTLVVTIISALIAGALVDLLFWFVFPSAWLFFIIPAVVGFSIDRFGRIPAECLEEDFERIARKTGLMCMFATLVAVGIATLPLLLFIDPIVLLLNLPFDIATAASMWIAYSRGVRSVTDIYYANQIDSE